MTFLDPVAGLVAAGLSVPAVLLLYFLKLRRQPLRVSSTLLWERAVHDVQVNAPFRWLRLSLLLLLQLLIAGVISAAIGRPALSGAAAISGRVVIVIDRSASMNALDGLVEDEAALARLRGGDPGEKGASRLEQAKIDSLELIDRLRRSAGLPGEGGVEVAIVAWAAQARRLTPFTADDTALREAVRAITPTDQPQDLGELVRLLEALGAGGADESSTPQRTRIFLMSDGGGFTREAGGVVINAPVDVTYVQIGRRQPPRTAPAPQPPTTTGPGGDVSPSNAANNVGIVAISARRDHEDPTLCRIFVRLISTDPSPRAAALQLRVDGRVEQIATVQLAGATDKAPGEGTHTFDLVNTRGGVVAVMLAAAGEGGSLAADDGAAVVLSPPKRPAVLVIAPGEDGAEADDFLMDVLEVMPLRLLETVDAQGYASLLRAGGIARFDLAIFDRVAAPPPPCASIHLGADPGVPGVSMTPLQEGADADHAEPAGGEAWTRVLMWERNNPIMRYVSLDNLVIAPPMRLSLPQPGRAEQDSGEPPPPKATVLATGSAGPLIALVNDRGNDRLLLAFEMSRTNWGPQASWLIFLANAVDVLTMRAEAMTGRAVTTAEPVRLMPAVGAQEITLDGPLTLAFPSGEDRRGGGGPVSIGLIERAGVYQVTGAADVNELAVNLVDEGESALPVRTEIRIGGKATAGTSVGEAAPREIWHWFVLGAIGLLGIEWNLYAWRMRL